MLKIRQPTFVRPATLLPTLLIAIVLLAPATKVLAAPFVRYTVSDLGGGTFQYNLFLTNVGTAPLSGLTVLNGNSVFGLDALSAVTAPQDVAGDPLADWSFLTPIPPLVDELSFFSLNSAGDVAIGQSLSGFSFHSSTNPSSISGSDFAVEGIDASTATQVDLGVAVASEPASTLLIGLAIAALLSSRVRGRRF